VRELTKARPRAPRRRTEVQVSRVPLLEREAELAAMNAVVDAAYSGAGRVIAIEGRAGMGKTRLVAEARALAAETGFEVLVARSADLEQEFAYGVVRQLFEPYLASLPLDEREEVMAGTAGLADRLFGDEALTGAASGDVSFAVLHGLYWLAANLAARSPTAIVIDDLHWTDAPTLRWLTYLARRLEGLPLVVVLGLRPPEQSVEKELLTELIADPSALVIRPTALSVTSVARWPGTSSRSSPRSRSSSRATRPPAATRCSCGRSSTRSTARASRRRPRTPGGYARSGRKAVTRAVTLRLSRSPPRRGGWPWRSPCSATAPSSSMRPSSRSSTTRHLASLAASSLARTDLLHVSTLNVEFVHPSCVPPSTSRSSRLSG
jgi:hypothetical protein